MISVTGEAGATRHARRRLDRRHDGGHVRAFGVMLALRVKEQDRAKASTIDVSMLEGQLALLGTMIGNYFADGEVPEADGHRLQGAAARTRPFTPRRAISRSRSPARSCGGNSARVIGLPELADDPRYRNNVDARRRTATR